MGLETANTINELVEAWPLQSDKIRQGAGHLRNVKKAIKTTLPNLTEPMTKTAAALNQLPDNFAAVLTELLKHVQKKGTIVLWDIINNGIPDGWVLCDGRTVAGYGVVPDMRDRFLLMAGSSYPYGGTGGSLSKTTDASGGHTPVIQGTSLTAAQNGPHNHVGITVQGSGDDNGFPGPLVLTQSFAPQGPSFLSGAFTENSGSGQSHTHGADPVPNHQHGIADIRPPYYAAAFIVKVIDYVAP